LVSRLIFQSLGLGLVVVYFDHRISVSKASFTNRCCVWVFCTIQETGWELALLIMSKVGHYILLNSAYYSLSYCVANSYRNGSLASMGWTKM